MAALTEDRNTPIRDGMDVAYDVAAATQIYAGSLVMLDASGNLVAGATATSQTCVGRAQENVDNSGGSAGDLTCVVRQGTFRWINDDAIDKTDIGTLAYIVDDQTVSQDNTGKSAAGTIVDVDSVGVWVKTMWGAIS